MIIVQMLNGHDSIKFLIKIVFVTKSVLKPRGVFEFLYTKRNRYEANRKLGFASFGFVRAAKFVLFCCHGTLQAGSI